LDGTQQLAVNPIFIYCLTTITTRSHMVERTTEFEANVPSHAARPASTNAAMLDLTPCSLITPHPLYLAMGHDQPERARAYKQWLNAGIAPDVLQHLRAYASQERALGDERFQRMVEPPWDAPPHAAHVGDQSWPARGTRLN
jgi:hypothetical protein